MTDQRSEPADAPPPEVLATAPDGRGCLWQLGRSAGASVIFGLLSIVVPIDTTFTFPIFAIVGLTVGVYAISHSRMVGGILGVALSLLGGLVSLFATFGGGYI